MIGKNKISMLITANSMIAKNINADNAQMNDC